jgi:S-formylglutathione hydrolase FrmB
MGMIYSATFTAVAVSAAQDLFEIAAPADAAVVLHSVRLGQSSDAGDAAAEMLPVQIVKGNTTSGSGGSAVTPTPLESGYAAAGAAVEANNTTQASAGTPLTVVADAFNVQVGWQWIPTPEERIVLSPSQRAVVRLSAAPADALTMSGTLVFEEIGG